MNFQSDVRGWHVCVIAEECDAFCKIGSAVTVAYLLQQLQNGNPRCLRLIADWHVSDRYAAQAIKSYALSSAGLLRLERRDWLECHPDAAVSFVRCAMARLGITESVAQ